MCCCWGASHCTDDVVVQQWSSVSTPNDPLREETRGMQGRLLHITITSLVPNPPGNEVTPSHALHYTQEACCRVSEVNARPQPFRADFKVDCPRKKAPVVRNHFMILSTGPDTKALWAGNCIKSIPSLYDTQHRAQHKALWAGNCIRSIPSLYTSTQVVI